MDRQSWVLRNRPDGVPSAANFELITEPAPALEPGEVLTRTVWLSLDPYMRGRLIDRKSYVPPVPIGGAMQGEGAGEVLASEDPAFAPGDVVVGSRFWQSHCVTPGKMLTKVERTAPLSAYLGVLGMPGVTAYQGMTDIAQVKPGETLVVSAASGPVGTVAGFLGKRAGAHVVGVAGGADKCAYVKDVLKFDECVDHREHKDLASLRRALLEKCPNGVDAYWENVGGVLQHAVFSILNDFARVVMCGMVSQYNDPAPQPGPNLMFTVQKRVRIQGLIVFDKPAYYAQWREMAAPWVADGSLPYREDVVDGLAAAPDALGGLVSGKNFGKLLVRVGADA